MIKEERRKKSRIQCIVLPKRSHLKANEPTKKRKSKEKYDIEYLKSAHKHSIYNQKEIMESDVCGCFSCKQIFQPKKFLTGVIKIILKVSLLCVLIVMWIL